MGQFNWTYIDEFNQKHKIGLYHGDTSGHVMLYCGSKIVAIDFDVQEDKKYSFFVNDELCHVSIVKKDGSFAYDLKIDKEADTIKNKERKKKEKSHFWKGLSIFLFVFILVVIALLLLK